MMKTGKIYRRWVYYIILITYKKTGKYKINPNRVLAAEIQNEDGIKDAADIILTL